MTVDIVLNDIRKVEADAVIVGFYEDERPLKGQAGWLDWLLCGALSQLIIAGRMRGTVGDVALLTSRKKIPAEKIFLVGLGPKTGLTPETLTQLLSLAARSAVDAGVKNVAVGLSSPAGMRHDEFLSSIDRGFTEGSGKSPIRVSIVAPDAETYERFSNILKTMVTMKGQSI